MTDPYDEGPDELALVELRAQLDAEPDTCPCGAPMGWCLCGDPRCWACDPHDPDAACDHTDGPTVDAQPQAPAPDHPHLTPPAPRAPGAAQMPDIRPPTLRPAIALDPVSRRYAAARGLPVSAARIAVETVTRLGDASPYAEEIRQHVRDPFEEFAEAFRAAFMPAWKRIQEAFRGVQRAAGPALRRRAAVLAARKAHRADGYRDNRHEPRPPSVCRFCEMPERAHGRYPHPDPAIGWHYYTPPTDEQILDRMRARRAVRLEP